MRSHDAWDVTDAGLVGDRRFHLVDETGRLVNNKRLGSLMLVVADYDTATNRLSLTFPDGTVVADEVTLGGALETGFYGTFRDGNCRPRAVVGGAHRVRGCRASPHRDDQGGCRDRP